MVPNGFAALALVQMMVFPVPISVVLPAPSKAMACSLNVPFPLLGRKLVSSW